jgi:hypothetical protein
MAGQIRTGPYPEQKPLDYDPQQDFKNFPDIPQGYKNWNDYVLAVLEANEKGEPGPRPLNVYGGQSIGDPDVQPMEWLMHTLGYGQLAPYLDQQNPKIRNMLDNMYYSGTSYDVFNPLGDQFFQAVTLLSAAAGGAGAFGAYVPASAGGGVFGTSLSGADLLKYASLANQAANVGRNPSGAGAGALAGSLAGSYFGIPGGSTLGRFAGGYLDPYVRGAIGDGSEGAYDLQGDASTGGTGLDARTLDRYLESQQGGPRGGVGVVGSIGPVDTGRAGTLDLQSGRGRGVIDVQGNPSEASPEQLQALYGRLRALVAHQGV